MLKADIASTGAAAAVDILAATARVRWVVHKIEFMTSAAAAVKVHEGTDSTTSRLFIGDMAANGGFVLEYPGGLVLATGAALKFTTDAGNAKGTCYYTKSQD